MTQVPLRQVAGHRVAPVLFAPDPEFRYRPPSVTEPFDLATARNLGLLEVALEHHATFMRDGLAEVYPDRCQVRTAAGRELAYDVLLIAIGARGAEAVPGALTFMDAADGDSFRDVLGELQGGGRHLVFAVPPGASWPLGLYELALLTSAYVREHGFADLTITLVTPEAHPMAIFGSRASAAVRGLLEQAGVAVRLNSTPICFEDGELITDEGEPITCDQVISLPRPQVVAIPGIPQQQEGFIPVDRYGSVLGVDRIYAAGDATGSRSSRGAWRRSRPIAPQPRSPRWRGPR